jgi:hypothetical protein
MGLDVVTLSRMQFALTIMFHYLEPFRGRAAAVQLHQEGRLRRRPQRRLVGRHRREVGRLRVVS